MATDSKEEVANLLVVVVDTNVFEWERLKEQLRLHVAQQRNGTTTESTEQASQEVELSLQSFFDSLMVFANAYLLQHRDNQIAVIANNPDGSATFLFDDSMWSGDTKYDRYSFSRTFRSIVQKNVRKLGTRIEEFVRSGFPARSSLAAALSMGLCYCNSRSVDPNVLEALSPRVLVVQASGDQTVQYIGAMNSAFAAQKSKVLVDAFVLTDQGSTILQQMCHLTGGIFFAPMELYPQSLTQYLLSVFLVDKATRSVLAPPVQPPVPLKASCFCHQKLVEKGKVCSACLSVFCEAYLRDKFLCPTCNTKRSDV